ncbi:MAG: Bax inhibitor-1 family protein [Clostridia bacterium]|nr:Bax inhibitor-1 family protein [Clostridia bacterium]
MDNFNNENENQTYTEVDVLNQNSVMPGDQISSRKYNLLIGLTLLWGFALNMLLVATVPVTFFSGLNMVIFFIAYFILCICGKIITYKSDNPWISFLGYNMVVIPFGMTLKIITYGYGENLITFAVGITGLVTLLMMALGIAFPKVFQTIGRALGITLLVTVIIEIVSSFFFVIPSLSTVIDYLVVLIFMGYIGYDWGRANACPKTVDNAIDNALEVYMDIINLFIRILRILARNSRNN